MNFKIKIMNKKLIITTVMIIVIAIIIYDGFNQEAKSHAGGAAYGYADDPHYGFTTCATAGCHMGAAPINDTGIISSDIPVAGYTPETVYTITATVTRAGHSRFGFEITPENSSGTNLGTLINTNTNTALTIGNSNYITHSLAGTTGTVGFHTWTFHWMSPVAGSGPVTFYGCFNATNNDGTNMGDTILLSNKSVIENTSNGFTDVSQNKTALSIFPNPCKDIASIILPVINSNQLLSVAVCNISGEKIPVPFNINNTEKAGGNIILNTSTIPTGIYFCKVTNSDNNIFTGKIIVIK